MTSFLTLHHTGSDHDEDKQVAGDDVIVPGQQQQHAALRRQTIPPSLPPGHRRDALPAWEPCTRPTPATLLHARGFGNGGQIGSSVREKGVVDRVGRACRGRGSRTRSTAHECMQPLCAACACVHARLDLRVCERNVAGV